MQGAEPGGGGGAGGTREQRLQLLLLPPTALLLKGDPPAAVLRPGQEIDLRARQEVPGSQPLPAVSKRGHGAAEWHTGFLPQHKHTYLGVIRLVRVHGTTHSVQPAGLSDTEVGVDGPLSSLRTAAQSGESPGFRPPPKKATAEPHGRGFPLLERFSPWCGAGVVMEVGPRVPMSTKQVWGIHTWWAASFRE